MAPSGAVSTMVSFQPQELRERVDDQRIIIDQQQPDGRCVAVLRSMGRAPAGRHLRCAFGLPFSPLLTPRVLIK